MEKSNPSEDNEAVTQDTFRRRDFFKKSAFGAAGAYVLAQGLSLGDSPSGTASATV
ncbi:MAG: hypothetical protein JWO82_3347, partial [Akkermansiaceae bacterium]|nr:hypothetical protein [Akkermansiaceae bacterium]